MKLRRPRTLLGMVLMGLAFVTVPLLIAVGNAMLELGQLAKESELVLADSATATLENGRLANLLNRMERSARQYYEIQAGDLLTFYDNDQAAFEMSVSALRSLPNDAAIGEQLARLTTVSRDVHRTLRGGPTQAALDKMLVGFSTLTETTRAVADGMRAKISDRFAMLQEDTRSAQQELGWLAAALIPGTLVLIGLFLLRRRSADAADRPSDSRARRRRFQQSYRGERPERHRDAGPPARVAAPPAQGVDGREEQVPAPHVARAQDASREHSRRNRALARRLRRRARHINSKKSRASSATTASSCRSSSRTC